MNTRLLLVCKEGEARQAYLDVIEPLDVHIDIVSSFGEVYKTMITKPYNGVIVDVTTKIRAPKEDKALVHEVLEEFPVVQLKWENQTDTISTLYFGQFRHSGSLEDFVNQQCRLFAARKIRSSRRIAVNFNLVLARNKNFGHADVHRTITIDVSKGGCFIYCSDEWEEHSNAWLIIKELADDRPIRAEVRWAIPWGKAMKIPGIGVMFKDIEGPQYEDICSKCGM